MTKPPCTELAALSYDSYDGVYLWCARCGWQETLGFQATLDDVVIAETRHVAEPLRPVDAA